MIGDPTKPEKKSSTPKGVKILSTKKRDFYFSPVGRGSGAGTPSVPKGEATTKKTVKPNNVTRSASVKKKNSDFLGKRKKVVGASCKKMVRQLGT